MRLKIKKSIDKKQLFQHFLEEIKRKDCSARELAIKFGLDDPIIAMRILYKITRKKKNVSSYWRQYKDGRQQPAAESVYAWKIQERKK